MSNYYKATCDALRESIDPGHINDLGVKAGSIDRLDHPFGAVVTHAMLTRWRGFGVMLSDDTVPDGPYDEYADVTGDVLTSYNAAHGAALVLTR